MLKVMKVLSENTTSLRSYSSTWFQNVNNLCESKGGNRVVEINIDVFTVYRSFSEK